MTNCAHCGSEIIGDSFNCSQCGQRYCNYHKDPINHDCNIIIESHSSQQITHTTPIYTEIPQISTLPHGFFHKISPIRRASEKRWAC